VHSTENNLIKIDAKIEGLGLRKSKNKWEVIGKTTELYLESIYIVQEISLNNKLSEKNNLTITPIEPYEKKCAQILEVIKTLANSPT
jgi:hypothetical protein